MMAWPSAAGWGRKTQAVSRIRRFCRTSYKSQVSANLADCQAEECETLRIGKLKQSGKMPGCFSGPGRRDPALRDGPGSGMIRIPNGEVPRENDRWHAEKASPHVDSKASSLSRRCARGEKRLCHDDLNCR
jgi:hypothetical protein